MSNPETKLEYKFRFIPTNPEASPDSSELARMYFQYTFAGGRVDFPCRASDVAKAFGVAIQSLPRLSRECGRVSVPDKLCECGKTLFWEPRYFKSRTDLEMFILREWRRTVCKECFARHQELERQREETENQEREARKAARKAKATKKHGVRVVGDCPNCDGVLVIRVGRNGGQFIGCSSFPGCEYARPLPKPIEVTDADYLDIERAKRLLAEARKCPECGEPLRKLTGKFGPFLGCFGYPKCRYTEKLEIETVQPAPQIVPQIPSPIRNPTPEFQAWADDLDQRAEMAVKTIDGENL